jgi:hypothetical protein
LLFQKSPVERADSENLARAEERSCVLDWGRKGGSRRKEKVKAVG